MVGDCESYGGRYFEVFEWELVSEGACGSSSGRCLGDEVGCA